MDGYRIFQLSMILLGVAALVILGWILYLYLQYRKGVLGKNKVDAALKKFGVIRRYKVGRDLSLSLNGKTAQIDHLLIGFFGILFVSTVNDSAEYYGDARDTHWMMVAEDKRQKMENLLEKNIQNMDVVRKIFAKNNIFNIRMEGVVVFCGRPKKSLIGITGGSADTLMTFKNFKSYLHKSKFEKDNNVDVPGLWDLLTKHQA